MGENPWVVDERVTMTLADYLRILRNHWLGTLLIAAVVTCAALGWSISQPAVYAANATGYVSIGGGDTNAASQSVGDALAKSKAKSYVAIASSRSVAQRVIDDLGLDATPGSLIGRIAVEQPLDTSLIEITARSGSPEQAQQLADAWVSALAAEVTEIDGQSSGTPTEGALVLRPIEDAALPSAPVSPRPLRDGALGLLAGLVLGVAYAVVRSQLDRRLRSSAEIEKKFGVSVVGAIPHTTTLEHAYGEAADLAVAEESQNPSFIAGEAFRKLRTNLSYMDVDDPPRVIVVTSARQSDGKSTVSTNLAAAIAMSGQRVVLVDADLRRPVVADTLGLVEGAGVTDVLVGRVDVEDVLQEHPDVPNLQVLAAGGVPPNPSEMLGSQTMRTLLEKLAQDALVVLDAPPLLPVTDAAVLTTVADGAIVVVSYGSTLDTELEQALGNLTSVRGRVLGVVFNRVPRRNSAGGYYYAGYYRAEGEGGRRSRGGSSRGGRRGATPPRRRAKGVKA